MSPLLPRPLPRRLVVPCRDALRAAVTAVALMAGAVGLALAAGKAAAPVAIEGTVTAVIDGDTLTFAPASGGPALVVRLEGIDAPEICQEGGAEAKQYLAEQVLKKPARLLPEAAVPPARLRPGAAATTDPVPGKLYVGEVEINRRMVEEGQAWSERVKWDRGPYVSQERMAQALSRGVHRVGAGSIPPKEFRRRHGPCP